jgi:AAHS family 4-hydroxybenzoate transporter-like MFS transporter
MSVSSCVNITGLIDRCPLGRLQIRIIVLCGLVALLDGFDLLAIGVAASAMAGSLHIAPNQLGAVFSAALFASAVTLGAVVCRATVFRGNGAGSAAHYFVGSGAWGTG